MRKAPLFIIFALGISAAAGAVDFGLLINLEPEYASGAEGEYFRFTTGYTPWVSASVTEKMGLYVSTKFALEFIFRDESADDNQEFFFEPERVEINIRPKETVYLTFGRQRFRDISGMVAAGIFDGFHGAFSLGRARITGGVFYTGLLHKKTAEILMTEGDRKDYGDSGEYFASKRVLASLAGEFPDLSSRMSLALSGLAQFDLNKYEESALHSQYLAVRYGLEPLDSLRFTITGIGAAMERAGRAKGHLAMALGADWEFPGDLPDMLTGELSWGSGAVSKAVGPFMPVNGIAQGTVFTPTLSGLMNGRLSYAVRPFSTLSLNATAAVFFRTDLETFNDPELNTSKERFLGGEFYGQLVWAPQSPLRITAGGGLFLPGGAFDKEADPRWKIDAGFILSL